MYSHSWIQIFKMKSIFFLSIVLGVSSAQIFVKVQQHGTGNLTTLTTYYIDFENFLKRNHDGQEEQFLSIGVSLGDEWISSNEDSQQCRCKASKKQEKETTVLGVSSAQILVKVQQQNTGNLTTMTTYYIDFEKFLKRNHDGQEEQILSIGVSLGNEWISSNEDGRQCRCKDPKSQEEETIFAKLKRILTITELKVHVSFVMYAIFFLFVYELLESCKRFQNVTKYRLARQKDEQY